ncbi:MAG: response regulator [Firmicutes bacterium]|nr:response regulator [Bacillota bacterium]
MSRIKVLIADDIDETRENIKRLLYFEPDLAVVGEARNGEEAVKQAEKLRPDIILMDINMPVLDGIGATEIISLRVPTASIIVISVQGEQEYLKKAMMAGAREYLIKPFSSDELADTIRKVYELERRRKLQQATHRALDQATRPKPQVVTVFSTKGGVGKTTLVTNLALSLQREVNTRVVVVDLDLQFGDVAVMLNVMPRRTITDLLQEFHLLDAELMENYLVEEQGVKILAAPNRPEYAELISPGQVEKILGVLKETYDFILIDTPAAFNETTLTALDAADQILMVAALDLPTIKNVKLSMEVLESLHHKGKVKLVLTRATSDVGIKAEDVERALNFRIASEIPSDGKIVTSAVNRGVPFVLSHPGSRVAQSVKDLAYLVMNNKGSQEELAAVGKRGLWGRLLGGRA